jgi:hypothetical protein
MPTLFVKCHACGHEFPSGVAHDVSEVGKVQLLGLLMRCPKCRSESRYVTHEFYFPPGVGDSDGLNATDAAGEGALPHDVAVGLRNRERPPTLQP